MKKWNGGLVITSLVYLCVVASARSQRSMNIMGYAGDPQRLTSVTGTVVQLSTPDDFAGATVQRDMVILKGVFFSFEVGCYRDTPSGTFVVHDWFKKVQSGKSHNIDLAGAVDEVLVDGRRIDLLNHSFTNSLVTKDYGTIPIAFTSGGKAPGSNTIYRCALAFSDEQLAMLRKQGTPLPEKEDAPSK